MAFDYNRRLEEKKKRNNYFKKEEVGNPKKIYLNYDRTRTELDGGKFKEYYCTSANQEQLLN